MLDPDFNLHLRDAGVARVFSVRKPTEDGIVTSIEAFDDRNRNILLMFGARKPGKPELEEWRTIVAQRREAGRLVMKRRTALATGRSAPRPLRGVCPCADAQQPPRIVSVGSALTEIIYALGAEKPAGRRRHAPASIPTPRGSCRRSATCARCRPRACCR